MTIVAINMSGTHKPREAFRVDAFVLVICLAIASLLVFMAAIGQIGILQVANIDANFTTAELETATGYDYFALVWGLLSMIACTIMAILVKFVGFIEGRIMQVFSLGIAIYWILGLVVLTFVSPFTDLSNGLYHSSSACALYMCECILFYLHSCRYVGE